MHLTAESANPLTEEIRWVISCSPW